MRNETWVSSPPPPPLSSREKKEVKTLSEMFLVLLARDDRRPKYMSVRISAPSYGICSLVLECVSSYRQVKGLNMSAQVPSRFLKHDILLLRRFFLW